jgi:urea transport system substrate-binding protein
MAFDDPINKKFILSFREKFGQEKMVNGIGKAGCNGLHLYALAAEKAGSLKDDDVLTPLPSIEFGATQGKIRVDATNNHTLCHSYVGKAAGDGIGDEIVKPAASPRCRRVLRQHEARPAVG